MRRREKETGGILTNPTSGTKHSTVFLESYAVHVSVLLEEQSLVACNRNLANTGSNR